MTHQSTSESEKFQSDFIEHKTAVRNGFKRRMRRFWPKWPDGKRNVLITAAEQEQYFHVSQERDAALNRRLGIQESPPSTVPDDWQAIIQFIRRECGSADSFNFQPMVLDRMAEDARRAALRIWRMFNKILPDIPPMLPEPKDDLAALLPWVIHCERIIQAKMIRAVNDGAVGNFQVVYEGGLDITLVRYLTDHPESAGWTNQQFADELKIHVKSINLQRTPNFCNYRKRAKADAKEVLAASQSSMRPNKGRRARPR